MILTCIVIYKGEVSTDNEVNGENEAGEKLAYLYDVANKNGFLDDLRKRGYDV